MILPTYPPDLRTLIRTSTYLICWAISEIPRLSHATPEWHSSRYSVHAGTLQSASGIFCILVPNMGQFPELTPVRSQTTEPWFATLEAGDTKSSIRQHLALMPARALHKSGFFRNQTGSLTVQLRRTIQTVPRRPDQNCWRSTWTCFQTRSLE